MKTKYKKELTELCQRFDYFKKSGDEMLKNGKIELLPTIINEMKNSKGLIDSFIKKELTFIKENN